jgi:protease YdgD
MREPVLSALKAPALKALALAMSLVPVGAAAVAQVAPSITVAGREWQAVGRLEVGQSSFCTVTLIAPELALTAAHCVIDTATGQMHRPDQIVVRLGYANGRAQVTRGVRSMTLSVAPPGVPGPDAMLGHVARDVAILALDRPVRPAEVVPVDLAPPRAEVPHRLTVVSYARGREEVAALQEDCLLITTRVDGALVLDCNIDRGSSGSPVIDRTGGTPRIVAVISARARMSQDGMPNADVALAAPVHVPGSAQRPVAPQVSAGGVRIRRGVDAQVPAAEGPRMLRPGASVVR